MKFLTKMTVMFDRIINLLAYFSIGLFIFAWFSVCTEIVMRYFLNRPLVWVVEISEYILVYMTFLGATWLLKREGHVSIDILPMFLSPRNDALLNIITSILGAISCIVFTWYAGQVTLDHFQRGIYDLKFLTLPLALLFAPMPIGSFLLFIQFVRRTKTYMEKWRKAGDKMRAA